MKIEKVDLTRFIETQIFKATSKRFQKNIRKLYYNSDSFYLIKINNAENGFYFIKQKEAVLTVKFFISNKDLDYKMLKSKIIEIAKGYNSKYLHISHYKNSKLIFDKFNKFDSMLQYERVQNLTSQTIQIETDFTVSDSVISYDELAAFFNTVFAEDDEYCKGNWDTMIHSFSNFKLPKVEFVIRNQEEIVGAVIGVKIAVLNKYYLHTIGVHPRFRGKQLGRKLMTLFLNETKDMTTYLDVLESAKVPIKLYESFKFDFVKVNSIYCRVEV